MEKKNLLKKVKLNGSKTICWQQLKNKKFLVMQTKDNIKKYLGFPKEVKVLKTKSNFFIKGPAFSFFYKILLKWVETLYKPLQKKLLFKGLGFKFRYSNIEKTKLEFKLGFSHFTTLIIPKKEIKIFLIKKNRLAIEGFNYSLVGNIAQKILMLRFPDSYNGKGLWYKNEFKILKQIKKT
jgi:hypothetical protein